MDLLSRSVLQMLNTEEEYGSSSPEYRLIKAKIEETLNVAGHHLGKPAENMLRRFVQEKQNAEQLNRRSFQTRSAFTTFSGATGPIRGLIAAELDSNPDNGKELANYIFSTQGHRIDPSAFKNVPDDFKRYVDALSPERKADLLDYIEKERLRVLSTYTVVKLEDGYWVLKSDDHDWLEKVPAGDGRAIYFVDTRTREVDEAHPPKPVEVGSKLIVKRFGPGVCHYYHALNQ